MNRPYIFCHMMISLDGKIMGTFMETPEGETAGNVFYNISFGSNPYYKHQGWLSAEGSSIMKQLKEAMLECTVSRLSSYNQEELAELDHCLMRLGVLLEKFAASDDTSCGDFPEL